MKISSLSKITGISPGGPPPRSARPDFTLITTVDSGASTVFLFMKMLKTRVIKLEFHVMFLHSIILKGRIIFGWKTDQVEIFSH